MTISSKIPIQIQDLCFSFNSQEVLKNINLEVAERDFLALIGPNGGGKTTLIKLILGLITPDKGWVKIFGSPPSQVSNLIGYVPQNVNINKEFPISAIDVVLMGRLRHGKKSFRNSEKDKAIAQSALEQLGMGNFSRQLIGCLSGGQRQRVFIARALATKPKILIMDEPGASIDPQGQSELYKILEELNQSITILLASHDLLTLASRIKSVACVNRALHHHNEAEITPDMLDLYQCPVDLIAHGLPHRVLRNH